jgi:RNA polymerase sigma factor for flagellar operon FliA
VPPLTPDQARLAASHTPFAERAVRAYCVRIGLPPVYLEDAIGDGFEGLCQAARTWQPARGSFPTHAYTRIVGSVVDGQRRADHLSRGMRKLVDQLEDVPAELRAAISLDAPTRTGLDEELEGGDTLDNGEATPEQQLLTAEAGDQLHDQVDHLPTQERDVIQGWFFDGVKQHELGDSMGISESRVSQVAKRGCQRLGRRMRAA